MSNGIKGTSRVPSPGSLQVAPMPERMEFRFATVDTESFRGADLKEATLGLKSPGGYFVVQLGAAGQVQMSRGLAGNARIPNFRDLTSEESADLKRVLTAERDRQTMPYDRKAYDRFKDAFESNEMTMSRAEYKKMRVNAEKRWDTGIQSILDKL
ncbi:MAG: hypothetical protein K1X89_08440 [Myxococcaceae bacterium]|nr:hypothetical protein [Myxococcaceae bacterium]